jgi:hypothetical protein
MGQEMRRGRRHKSEAHRHPILTHIYQTGLDWIQDRFGNNSSKQLTI